MLWYSSFYYCCATNYDASKNGGSNKERIFLVFLDLYSSKALFITGDSVNFLFITNLFLPFRTQFIIPGNSRAMILRDNSGLILALGISTWKGAIRNLR